MGPKSLKFRQKLWPRQYDGWDRVAGADSILSGAGDVDDAGDMDGEFLGPHFLAILQSLTKENYEPIVC